MKQRSYDNSPSLYLIPTPIGNMEDMTIRAISILKEVDFLLCEDTRVTGQLLKYFDIKKKMYSCHEHNETYLGSMVLAALDEGKNIGLVTDRGTPIISDPGYKVVEFVIKNKKNVIALPGATALIPALIMSGVNPSPFLFYGFLNAKEGKREKELESMKRNIHTMIFYEAPHRIESTLKSIYKVLGDRRIALCREISKMYEEVIRGSVSEVILEISDIKGEIVIVVEGNTEVEDYSLLLLKEHVEMYIEDGLSDKEAIKKVSLEREIPKAIVYKEYHIDNK